MRTKMSLARRLLSQFEGLSKTVFHYTSFTVLHKVLTSNEFRLVNAVQPGNSAERMLEPGATFKRGQEDSQGKRRIETTAPTGSAAGRAAQKRYYFCVARSVAGDYQGVHSGAVEIVLDGDKLAQRYQAAPVNYWGDGWNKDEMEDRIYSKTPTIPNAISYMKEIHLLWSVRSDEDYPYPRFSKEITNSGIGSDADKLRQCWLIAKQNNVGFYVYKDERAFRVLDKRKALPMSEFKLRPTNQQYINQKKVPDYPVSSYKNDNRYDWQRDRDKFDPWLELYYKKNVADLSDKARNILRFSYSRDFGSQLQNDLHKSNKEENAKIIKILQKNKWVDISAFIEFIKDKWEKIQRIDAREEAKENYRTIRKDVAHEIEIGTPLADLINTVTGRCGECRIKGGYDLEDYPDDLPILISTPYSREGQQLAPLQWKLPASYDDQVKQFRQAVKDDKYGSGHEFYKDGDYFYDKYNKKKEPE